MMPSSDWDRFRVAAAESLRRGDVEGAIIALCRALHAQRDSTSALQLVCRLLLENPTACLPPPPVAQNPICGPVSIVTCSIDAGKFRRVRESWERAFANASWELIGIHDAQSLAEGLQRGFARARGEVIVFAHDDIDILSGDLGGALGRALSATDVVGVVGTTRLSGPAHAWSGTAYTRGRIVHPPQGGNGLKLDLFNLATGVTAGLQAIDGVFMAAKRETVEAIGFDAGTFDGFHLYDLDFSYRAYLSGRRVGVTSEVILCHESDGSFDDNWLEYSRRFLAKFPDVNGERSQNVILGVPFADPQSLLAFCARLDEAGRRALAA